MQRMFLVSGLGFLVQAAVQAIGFRIWKLTVWLWAIPFGFFEMMP